MQETAEALYKSRMTGFDLWLGGQIEPAGGDGLKVQGTAARYGDIIDHADEFLGPYQLRLQQGCFKRSLDQRNLYVKLQYNHKGQVLDSTKQNLKLLPYEDRLDFTGEMDPADAFSRSIHLGMSEGDIAGASVGMSVREYEWDDRGVMNIKEASLHGKDVSIVDTPAHPDCFSEISLGMATAPTRRATLERLLDKFGAETLANLQTMAKELRLSERVAPAKDLTDEDEVGNVGVEDASRERLMHLEAEELELAELTGWR